MEKGRASYSLGLWKGLCRRQGELWVLSHKVLMAVLGEYEGSLLLAEHKSEPCPPTASLA